MQLQKRMRNTSIYFSGMTPKIFSSENERKRKMHNYVTNSSMTPARMYTHSHTHTQSTVHIKIQKLQWKNKPKTLKRVHT